MPHKQQSRSLSKFTVKNGSKMMFGAIAVLGLISFGLAIASGKGSPSILLAVIGAILFFWSQTAEPVKFGPDHIEIRSAPFAALKLVHYDEIAMVDQPKPKKAKLLLTKDGRKKRKPIALPLHLLSTTDQRRLLRRLEDQLLVDN